MKERIRHKVFVEICIKNIENSNRFHQNQFFFVVVHFFPTKLRFTNFFLNVRHSFECISFLFYIFSASGLVGVDRVGFWKMLWSNTNQ